MRLIDADALIDTLVNISNNDQFRFFPVWIEKQIGAQPTVAMPKDPEAATPTWRRGKPFCGACGLRIRGGKFCGECGRPIAWEGR